MPEGPEGPPAICSSRETSCVLGANVPSLMCPQQSRDGGQACRKLEHTQFPYQLLSTRWCPAKSSLVY